MLSLVLLPLRTWLLNRYSQDLKKKRVPAAFNSVNPLPRNVTGLSEAATNNYIAATGKTTAKGLLLRPAWKTRH
jgi:hypothetical protein